MKLYQLAKLIRSKNAGPFMLTIDILFETDAAFLEVVNSHVLSKELIADLYKRELEEIQYYELPLAKAVKFSFPRPAPSGDFLDRDVYGAQFHEPLVNLDIPIKGKIEPRISKAK